MERYSLICAGIKTNCHSLVAAMSAMQITEEPCAIIITKDGDVFAEKWLVHKPSLVKSVPDRAWVYKVHRWLGPGGLSLMNDEEFIIHTGVVAVTEDDAHYDT